MFSSSVGDHGSNSSNHTRSFGVFLLFCWRFYILTRFFLSFLSFFICCHKICDFFQTLFIGWFKISLKQCEHEPSIPKIENHVYINEKPYFANSKIFIPCTSRCSNNHIQFFEYPCHLFPPLMDKFMVQHFHKIAHGPINDVRFLLSKL
jgi:hypothetical protein